MNGHAFELAGVSPKTSACCACELRLEMYFIHMYAQFGCGAFVASIHVSAQPVAPSFGIVSLTGALRLQRAGLVRPDGADDGVSVLEQVDLVGGESQYFLISGFCCFSRLTAASNCVFVQLVGILDAEARLRLHR